MADSMNYEAMSHADLVELVKMQRDLLDWRGGVIVNLEREAKLARELIAALEREAELMPQLYQQQAAQQVKETAKETAKTTKKIAADFLLQLFAGIDKPKMSNLKIKAKRCIKARGRRREAALLQSKSGRFAKDKELNDKFIELAGVVPHGVSARKFVISTLIAAKRALGDNTADEANLTKNEISQFVMLYRRNR